jgi:hypothetical protein
LKKVAKRTKTRVLTKNDITIFSIPSDNQQKESCLPVILELEKLYAFWADLVLILHADWLRTFLDVGGRG